ncbi:DUF2218 domain-containing protein [Ancylobacter radicis]|uniref:DUF2218 domain-containing protein n=1 Tax=Ancylobacter radicis TaxID=2836179 RepID=A0ABS5R447_9HYPH|nr:DUF2218 domain-containing protein [Ancylobacter radicis]MBS9476440.1 DUF2218 domain-containing protein [Ancylobacter radicis]
MITTQAEVPTTHGSRYLQQLCKHWAHKLEVAFTPERGEVKLPDGAVATMIAGEAALAVHITAPNAETLARMKDVVARHLDRFAFREAPLPFDWHDAAA